MVGDLVLVNNAHPKGRMAGFGVGSYQPSQIIASSVEDVRIVKNRHLSKGSSQEKPGKKK
jgi:hypothetical protein